MQCPPGGKFVVLEVLLDKGEESKTKNELWTSYSHAPNINAKNYSARRSATRDLDLLQ